MSCIYIHISYIYMYVTSKNIFSITALRWHFGS